MSRRSVRSSIVVALVVGALAASSSSAEPTVSAPPALAALSSPALDARAASDATRFVRLIRASSTLHGRLVAEQTLFTRADDVALSADERAEALALFADVLDHIVTLDGLTGFHRDFWRLNPVTDRLRHARHFDLAFAAYLEKLSLALDFVDLTLNKPQFEKLLDEGFVDAGVPAGAYTALKWHVVHVEEVGKALAARGYARTLRGTNETLAKDRAFGVLLARTDDRYDDVEQHLTSKSVKLFGGNSFDIGKDFAHMAWFPIQAETAEWLGDTRVNRKNEMLISLEQVRAAEKLAEPGDVIVERRNWYLSNVGLPGFWPHAAIWLGLPSELSSWAKDPEIEQAFEGSFIQMLQKKYPDAWKNYTQPSPEGDPRRIIEAISEGVVFNAAEESIRADYVAAIRPTLTRVEKAKAIERAFSYAGRPYDFDFDFYTDATLVCSELVFKAYEPRAGMRGLKLGLEKTLGRMALGPNGIVRTFDHDFAGALHPFDFVFFLDGSEKAGTAHFSDVAALRSSWQRPKWDVVQQ